jgi:splicing factor 3A subunit 1
MQKEGMNYHFDFLKPQHSLFHYFTKLVEQYTKVRAIIGTGPARTCHGTF